MKIQLYEQKGTTTVSISAEISGAGDLRIAGCDTGKLPLEMFGDSDYEYWLTISQEHKDRLLLACIKRLVGGRADAVSQLSQFAAEHDIPCRFENYI